MKFKAVVLALLMTVIAINPGYGDCNRYDLDSLFFEEYDGSHWDNSYGNIKIVWSANAPTVDGESVTRQMTKSQLEWTRTAFKSWDDALVSVSFVESRTYRVADVIVGITQLNDSLLAQWSAWDSKDINGIRSEASIRINSSKKKWFSSKAQFIHVVQQEIGNVLGLGDIRPNSSFVSVMEDPPQNPVGNSYIGEFDTGLVRQLYRECS